MPPKSRRLIVIDDHPLCAAAISAAIEGLRVERKVETVGSIRDALRIQDRTGIELIILDLMLPDAFGLQGIQTIKDAFPGTPVCVMSSRTDAVTLRQVKALDVTGFVPKTLAFDEMSLAIAQILSGDRTFPRVVGHGEDAETGLSAAEHRVMQSLSLGLQNKQIAFELGLSESTVKSHLARIFEKLQVINRSQAILAYERAMNGEIGIEN